jgi:hypothetical protein
MAEGEQLAVEYFDSLVEFIGQLVKGQVNANLEEKRNTQPLESSAASDSQSASNEHTMSLQRGFLLRRGKIVDAYAYVNCYKVQLDQASATSVAIHLAQSATGAIGMRQVTTLPPGVTVWVMQHHLMPDISVIIGVEPPFSTDPTKALPDQIGLGLTCGWKGDDAHPFVLSHEKAGGVSDWSDNQPLDSTMVGEWGFFAETGVRFFADPFMFQVAVNEACGVFGFYLDSLLRVTGHNLEIRSSGSDMSALNDEGEFNLLQGYTPYFWEQLGFLTTSAEGFRKYTAEQIQVEGEKEYNPVEPKYDDQQPFHRARHFQGYLGQGGKRQIILPPSSLDVLQYGSPNQLRGVFSEDITLTGLYTLRSAKGISLVKRPNIPVAKCMKLPTHKDGDSATDYRAAGRSDFGGEGAVAHKVTDRLETPEDESISLMQAAGLNGLHAYLFNWEANHPFVYHKKDWDNQDDEECPISAGIELPSFKHLASNQYFDDAAYAEEKVDHRYGDSVRYYKNESYLTLLDDGGVVIGDGFGAEIRMTGGSVFITAPGDVWMKGGRNVNSWAGHDVITKAKNSIDITATDKDVRIKAEKNMQVLAGNSGTGGLLLESRGAGEYNFEGVGEDIQSTGVMLRSQRGPIVTWAPDIYMRTGSDGGDIASGNIVLDTLGETGSGSIRTTSNTFEMFLKTGAYHNFMPGGVGTVDVVNEFTAAQTSLGNRLLVDNFATINGNLYMNGNIFVAGGHISTQLANQYNGLIGDLTFRGGHKEVLRHIQDAVTDRQEQLQKDGDKFYKTEFDDRWYDEKRPGNKEVIARAMTSMRSREQYHTKEFTLFEDRWQALARLNGYANVWTEKAVDVGPGAEVPQITFPYPGTDEDGYDLNGDMKFVGSELGEIGDGKILAAPTSNPVYEDPKLTVTTKKLNESYTII